MKFKTYNYTLLTIISLIGFNLFCLGQIDTASFNYPSKLNYKRGGVVYKLDGKSIHLKSLKFDVNNNRVSGSHEYHLAAYNLLEVDKIEVRKGNEAWFWGAALGALATSVAHRLVQEGAGEGTYLFSLVGFGIGLGIGSSKKTYKTIYDNGYFVH